MANSNVSSVAALIHGTQNNSNVSSANHSKTQNDFGAFLNYATGGNTQGNLKDLSQQQMTSVDSGDYSKNFYNKEANQAQYKDVKIQRADSSGIADKVNDTVRDKMNSVADDIKEVLKDKLGVSEDELMQAMQTLGLSFLDLMNPSNLAALTAELTGSQDISTLLLSEDFQMLYSEIGTITKDLLSELGLTNEQLDELLAQLETPIDAELTADGAELMDGPKEADASDEDQTNAKLAGDLQASTPDEMIHAQMKAGMDAQDNENNDSLLKNQNSVSEQGSELNEQTDSLIKETKSLSEENSDGFSGGEEMSKQGNAQPSVTYRTVNTLGSDGVTYTQTVQQTYIDVADIMKQVSQFTSRIQVGQLQSTIEMQLNPANLGKIYLQVASRDGVVTAQIAAQNEAVKEVLENQIAVLKENMNQQGIKVEAVEVTVATHEFDQNLEQNFYNRQNEHREETEKRSRRNINLNDLEDIAEELTDEESLTAKIMTENGNSVDMNA